MGRTTRILARLFAAILLCGAPMLPGGTRATPLGAGQNPAAPPPAPDFDDRGTFAISFQGRPIGTERFSIRSSREQVTAEADIELRGAQGGQNINVRSVHELILNSRLEPQTYTMNQKGSPEFHLDVNFRASPAISRLRLAGQKADDERDFALPKDVVVLDDNVVHHYQILLDLFALKPGKKRTFNAYVPQEALPGVLTLEEAGDEAVNLGGQTVTLRHLVLSTDLVQVDLWVDAQQHLQRLYNSSLRIEAVRRK